VSNFRRSFHVKMGNFVRNTTPIGVLDLSVAASKGAQSRCQLGGTRRLLLKFYTPGREYITGKRRLKIVQKQGYIRKSRNTKARDKPVSGQVGAKIV
jgi:hypothetical protein